MNNLNMTSSSEKSLKKQELNSITIGGNVQESTLISGNDNIVNQIFSTWELLFEHDKDGNPIGLEGNLDQLIDAVNRGYSIRIKIYHPKNVIKLIDGESVNLDNGVVHATNTKEISLGKNDSGNYVYQEKPYHYYVIASSNGNLHERRIFLDGKERNTTNRKRRMAWFGLVPSKK